MRRRGILSCIAGSAACLAGGAPLIVPFRSEAQQAVPRARIGVLSPLAAATATPMIGGLREGLRELGWEDGRNATLETRFADGKLELLPQLAAELVRLKVDVIVAGSNPGGAAARQATGTIPIVLVTTGDPAADGIVESLARPGRNVTGMTTLGVNLIAKQLELLKESFPGLARVVVLVNPASPYIATIRAEAAEASRTLGIELRELAALDPAGIEKAFQRIPSEGAGAIMVPPDIMFITHRARVAELAGQSGLPATYFDREFVLAGGLMFYGASLPRMYRQAASYVDKILKGARPGDLPIERPTQLELVVNLRSAKRSGIAIPPALVARADEVIE
jgi:putative tryptophan/tyrosine transport system substrate-binding protein